MNLWLMSLPWIFGTLLGIVAVVGLVFWLDND